MFEECLVESHGGSVSPRLRRIAVASVTLQVAAAAVLIFLPLLHPEVLRLHADPPKIALPVTLKPLVHPVQTSTSNSSTAPTTAGPTTAAAGSLMPLIGIARRTAEDPPAIAEIGTGMNSSSSIFSALSSAAHAGPAVSLVPARPIRVSTGVAQGLLITPIRPVYPQIAKAAHIDGDVIVNAVISRTGTVEELRIISGPAMLRSAAMDAIRAARYHPYLLNGEPTEVQVSITVSFHLSA